MPIGNGRLGAMVPGQVGLDNIVINQDTLWTTPFIDRSNPDAKKNFEKIRQLLREGNAEEADYALLPCDDLCAKVFGRICADV